MTTHDELDAALQTVERILNSDPTRNVFRLPPNMLRILTVLRRVEVLDHDTINIGLKIKSDAKMAIKRLRVYLEPYGIKIKSQRATGYYLTEEMKTRITKFVKNGIVTVEGKHEPGPEMEGAHIAATGTDEARVAA